MAELLNFPQFDYFTIAKGYEEFPTSPIAEFPIRQIETNEILTGKIELTITPESLGVKGYEVKGVNSPIEDWSKVTSYIDQQLAIVETSSGSFTNEIPSFALDPAKREVVQTADGKVFIKEKTVTPKNDNTALLIGALVVLYLMADL
jgi:hypothetical protein